MQVVNKMIGEIITDGKTLWINDENGCVLRVNCMDILKDDMKAIPVDIRLTGDMTEVIRVI